MESLVRALWALELRVAKCELPTGAFLWCLFFCCVNSNTQLCHRDAYVDLCERGLVRMSGESRGGTLTGISSPGCTLDDKRRIRRVAASHLQAQPQRGQEHPSRRRWRADSRSLPSRSRRGARRVAGERKLSLRACPPPHQRRVAKRRPHVCAFADEAHRLVRHGTGSPRLATFSRRLVVQDDSQTLHDLELGRCRAVLQTPCDRRIIRYRLSKPRQLERRRKPSAYALIIRSGEVSHLVVEQTREQLLARSCQEHACANRYHS